jgi:hypothetical protein
VIASCPGPATAKKETLVPIQYAFQGQCECSGEYKALQGINSLVIQPVTDYAAPHEMKGKLFPFNASLEAVKLIQLV